MTNPSIYHKQGYNCAEAILKSYNEEFNTSIPIAIGSGMGTGLSVDSICGAVNAAAIVLGFIKEESLTLSQMKHVTTQEN